MDAGSLAAVIVSAISAAAALASSKNARRASEKNAVVVSATDVEKSRLAMETDAYNRARKMDIETIERKDRELALLREQVDSLLIVKEQNEHLNADVKRVDADNQLLHEQNEGLRAQVRKLETKVRRLEGRASHTHNQESMQDDSVDYVGVDTNPYLEAQGGK